MRLDLRSYHPAPPDSLQSHSVELLGEFPGDLADVSQVRFRGLIHDCNWDVRGGSSEEAVSEKRVGRRITVERLQ